MCSRHWEFRSERKKTNTLPNYYVRNIKTAKKLHLENNQEIINGDWSFFLL